MSGKITPMLAQYLEIKGQHPDALLLFRMGDFYETFFEDAEQLANITGVVLTTRDRNSDHPIPLAGVPHHALEGYLSRLLEAGLTVAICEQVEDPALAKGLVKREVVEVISPGTATSPELLPSATGVYCLAYLAPQPSPVGWALMDASTGDFRCGQEDVSLPAICERHAVREVIVREDTDGDLLAAWRSALPEVVFNTVSAAWFHPSFAQRTLQDHFQVSHLDAFGLGAEEQALATAAAGALLRYLSSLTLRRPDQITSLRFTPPGDRLRLDGETLRNLEIFRTFSGDKGPGTLIHHLDDTVTPLGHRLLEHRLAEPLTDLTTLALWHRGVASAVTDRDWRQDLRRRLQQVGDIERWANRAARGNLGPAQLRQLGLSLATVQELPAATAGQDKHEHPVAVWARDIPELGSLAERILGTLPEQPPALLRSGGYIRDGFHAELDGCRKVASDTKGFLASLQAAERERTGISNLKVGYNKVFGYYYEVTKKNVDKVPDDYEQKQTLVNANRYHTPALKDAEQKILAAEEKATELEKEIYRQLLTTVAEALPRIHAAGQQVAAIDLLLSFAELAEQRDYCQPHCDNSPRLEIVAGRHPVVERLLTRDFIPNDTSLDGDDNQIILLTGPNMGGKSTYLRQVALITLMAQIGSFVPAETARIGIADRIFTRVGASDNLARGQSTFFSEMSETARILHQMSARSLVVLDEIGRGTSTYDGLSLAWAITEHLQSPLGPRPRTVFATHYHELTTLADSLTGIINLRLEVKEWEGKIIFLHKVAPGRSDRSYGIHVARLAGIPDPVLQRAENLLTHLSEEDQRSQTGREWHRPADGSTSAADAGGGTPYAVIAHHQQLTLFRDGERDALDALRRLDLDRLSPVEAFMWLVKIRNQMPTE